MSAELESMVRELKDRQDIRDCLMRYCRGVDRFDRAMLLSAYHPDAVDDHGDFVGGVEDFADWAFAYHTRFQTRTMHVIANHHCELSGDSAHSETYWIFVAVNKDAPHHTLATGRYIDRFEKRDNRWAIAARICVMNGLDGQTDPLAQAGDLAFVHSMRDATDASYMRPLTIDPARFTKGSAAQQASPA